MVETTIADLGGLHIAVNNAGINRNAAAEDTTEADWDATFGVNTKGLFLCCQVRAPCSIPRRALYHAHFIHLQQNFSSFTRRNLCICFSCSLRRGSMYCWWLSPCVKAHNAICGLIQKVKIPIGNATFGLSPILEKLRYNLCF